jgi:hypothetical protein
MDHKTPPQPPLHPKKALADMFQESARKKTLAYDPVFSTNSAQKKEALSEINPVLFAPSVKKKKIHPRDLLKNPRAAFVFAEIMRPII